MIDRPKRETRTSGHGWPGVTPSALRGHHRSNRPGGIKRISASPDRRGARLLALRLSCVDKKPNAKNE
jgi:hypothetical protein